MSNRKLLIATGNAGKLRELRSMLSDLSFDLIGLRDFTNIQMVDETGSTFRENAALKAIGYAQQTGVLTLADDSGLEVDALGGAPGVRSARYLDANASYADRIKALLKEIDAACKSNRAARFVSAVAIASSSGDILYITQRTCEGQLAASPRGSGGFGYDPIFIPDGYTETFGELSEVTKNQISHRARAITGARAFLSSLTALQSDS